MKKLLICAVIVCGLSATPTALVRAKPQRKQPVKQLWDYAIADVATATAPTNYDGRILVPFPLEAALLSERKTLLLPHEVR